MRQRFFTHPVLNTPYAPPQRHWELDGNGQPTGTVIDQRRPSALASPLPLPKRNHRPRRRQEKQEEGRGEQERERERERGGKGQNQEEGKGEKARSPGADGSGPAQAPDPTERLNEIRRHVAAWRALTDPSQWRVTPETARLLQHWRHHRFAAFRPFFCQIEAVETMIWLTEVAPTLGHNTSLLRQHLQAANEAANPGLFRLALKMATGAGKTTVMAMLIAWQTLNALRHPGSSRFSRGFLIVCPGLTIRDRLRVLHPQEEDNYYCQREIVPVDWLPDLLRARIVITNYHAFRLRETLTAAKGTRALLQGHGPALRTTETEGEMIRRVLPELMGMPGIVVLNDEAHHCYREKPPPAGDTPPLTGESREEAKKNNTAARLWIKGLEAVSRHLGLTAVYDLSATPFFLRGAGYGEGTLFPWTVSDFSLMDAIECGIVKLPRVPHLEGFPRAEEAVTHGLWERVGKKLPKKGKGQGGSGDPCPCPLPWGLPIEARTALEALYGLYKATFELWAREGVPVPPVFVVICNTVATSKRVYDFLSGEGRIGPEEENLGGEELGGDSGTGGPDHFLLFRNHDSQGNRHALPRTLLIDSQQLDSGAALEDGFRKAAAAEIAQIRGALLDRSDAPIAARALSDGDLLREMVNTVGKPGRLGEQIRCVVSVSMLTEGWDANTVTHILGLRAFGSQLLCEQVVGRALRRQSYALDDQGRLPPEYADILGIPFDFAAEPVRAKPTRPQETLCVQALPERVMREIRFPRVEGYWLAPPGDSVTARFTEASRLVLTPALVARAHSQSDGIPGKEDGDSPASLRAIRPGTLIHLLTRHLLWRHFRDADGSPRQHLFAPLRQIVRQWLEEGCLRCEEGTFPAQLLLPVLADTATDRMRTALTLSSPPGEGKMTALLDPVAPTGSTNSVRFTTNQTDRYQTSPRHCHLNWVLLDSPEEAEFLRRIEAHPRLRAYVKNRSLGFEIPYLRAGTLRRYLPDFILQIEDGWPDPLNLVVEIRAFGKEDALEKAQTMHKAWLPGVNALATHGRWAFAALSPEESPIGEAIERLLAELLEVGRTGAPS